MQENTPIYLDYAATNPLDREILSKMMMVSTHYGNPSSVHKLGKNAKIRLERARELIADNIFVDPNEIIFTSGATESNNTVLESVSRANKNAHIITTKLEHKSILEKLEQDKNIEVSFVETDSEGLINIDDLKSKIRDNTKLITIHYVNNETGTIQPIKEICEMLRDTGILIHIDAAQALGHVPLDMSKLDVDYMSISGHKIGAPKGIGLLYIKSDSKLNPLIYGGEQERGRRAGTENLIYAHAISVGVRKAVRDFDERRATEQLLKNLFLSELNSLGVPYELNASKNVSPHIINIYLPFVTTDIMLTRLDLKDVYVSGGSACNAGTVQPSHVITDMYDENRANRSIRVSLNYMTTEDEIKKAATIFKEIYESLK
ncbi:cysteine desulfurase family protein [Phocicoccus pinnipedialis]|uniref:cysteine desulfurase n=1 Tax=Phocicoccus pinnipedialis TaxID=110845 RepID=A0A6V7RGC0_9BACL|nr:cysteine desulfurase family protein [Jeotgalicoccus pinnipedialis]MBP1939222.1 cysteine desulfurase [Jeotgalicoccus pinnipedialis]CAD2076246.1 Cysteine desulfurase [Jeotgalicoccus pinnipedialis]